MSYKITQENFENWLDSIPEIEFASTTTGKQNKSIGVHSTNTYFVKYKLLDGQTHKEIFRYVSEAVKKFNSIEIS